jgi:hypothetical protein
MMRQRDLSDFDITSKLTADVTDAEHAMIFALFDLAYRDANHGYLQKSLGKLRNIAIATHDGEPAGFGLGELRVLDLPRLPGTSVAMAGICCIDARFRRRGLFGALERSAMAVSSAMPAGNWLSCGRMAHPASFRTMTSNPSAIPKRGVPLTAWQQQIGSAIAAEYGVPGFDPETFVCIGTGEPIGYPIIEMDLRPEEWDVFRAVNRDRGDSLLGMAWQPAAPAGWDE